MWAHRPGGRHGPTGHAGAVDREVDDSEDPDAAEAIRCRAGLVAELEAEGVASAQVLAVVGAVPRHRFTGGHSVRASYGNHPLPIGDGQTISQPLVVAWMAEAAELGGGDRVLEVGCGSGYGAAVLAGLAAEVVSVERIDRLATTARHALAQVGVDNVTVVHGDGTDGWVAGAPYDAIVVTAAAPEVPDALLEQLADGGRLVVPVGGPEGQRLVRVRRRGDQREVEDLGAVAFVPLVGSGGWTGS